ncbi:MAG: hypothetical protein ACI3XM_11705 [Eubacteriales bacterium]
MRRYSFGGTAKSFTTHHLALGIGDHTPEIEAFARMMDIRLEKPLEN